MIDDYLGKLPEGQRAGLERVRRIAMAVVPEADDTIGYGMPVLKYKGKYVIGFAAFKDHLSVFPGAEPIETLKDKLAQYKTSKGTIQFTQDIPLPEPLLKEILMLCYERASSGF